ncbi:MULTISPECIES: imidazolonepropionase [Kosakonia]|uniref:imidazolonepropionase n=1 Tax=Kosakonia TaxID=1330547 RepID=UPI0008C56900|nr:MULTISPECIES: imidazolonepropionase [Kosakonia]PTA89655.1 imidazolonepropionase [Kosakonia sp. H7A]SET29230.1 imidazolonepropionase [Kosakonia radicincitans]
MRILWRHCQIATMEAGKYNLIPHAAMITDGPRIVWLGEEGTQPDDAIDREVDLHGRLVTPGLIDCHSHSVFGGDRSQEFEMRLNGASYAEIAAAGGGIISTVNATRNASQQQLLESARKRIHALRKDGVTTLEIKSGYGLSFADEGKMLQVIRALGAEMPLTIFSTCLAAHALPGEYQGRADDYIDEIYQHWLPAWHAQGLVDAVDAFCEHLAFSPQQVERVFHKAQQLGLPVKLHAEQLSLLHGAGLAARYNALSADHLEYLCEEDIVLMAEHGTTAVLLPGAFYFLRESQQPPVALLRQHQVPMAISSDLNPGTSPVLSLRLMMNMACTLFRLTPEEALAGVTCHAARALGISDRCGTLQAGKEASFVAWDVAHPAELSYWLGGTLSKQVIYQGEEVWHD